MTQEQLLDQVCELVTTEAKKGPGTLLLVHDTDWHVIRLPVPLDAAAKLIDIFDAAKITGGLPPSFWLSLARKLWAIESSKTDKKPTVDFKKLGELRRGKTTGNTDDSGSRKPTG